MPAIRVLAISGKGKTGPGDFLDSAALLGADACLEKPFGQSELVGKVTALAHG